MASGSESEAVKGNGPCTPSPSPPRKKTRVSPRSTGPKDYKALDDPFRNADATDGEGHHLFEEELSESEDSTGSDGEYGKEHPVVNVEEAGEVVV